MTESKIYLLKAIISFENKAYELIKLMTKEFELDLTSDYPFSKLLVRSNNLWRGKLSGNWHYQFHGNSCKFTNNTSKQLLDVKVIPPGNYNVIDCFYLFEYIKSTPELDFARSKFNTLNDLWLVMNELENDKLVSNIYQLPCKSFVLNHEILPHDLK